jgi:hypothetical protein
MNNKNLTVDYKLINEGKDKYLETDKKLFDEKCPEHNYINPIMGRRRRVIAIGDIHGNYDLAIKCLKIAGVIDADHRWITDGKDKDTVVVQVGDQIDSCRPKNPNDLLPCKEGDTINDKAEDIKILEYFSKLDKQARKSGGMVISLLGNHELMNVMGDMRYVSHENLISHDAKSSNPIKGMDARKQLFSVGNKYANFLGCTRLSSIIIGDFIFVHAGIVPKFLKDNNIKGPNDILTINHLVRKWLFNQLDKNENVDQIVNSSPTSMFWDRFLGMIKPDLNISDPKCQILETGVLKTMEVKSMIVGHTPQFHPFNKGITGSCIRDNKLAAIYRVDFGGSHAFSPFDGEYMRTEKVMESRKPQILEIKYDNMNELYNKPIVSILA